MGFNSGLKGLSSYSLRSSYLAVPEQTTPALFGSLWALEGALVASLSQVAGVLSAGTKESTTARASVALSTKEPHHSARSMSLERNYIIEVTVLTPLVFLRCTWLLEGFTRPRAEPLSSRPITN